MYRIHSGTKTSCGACSDTEERLLAMEARVRRDGMGWGNGVGVGVRNVTRHGHDVAPDMRSARNSDVKKLSVQKSSICVRVCE